MSGWELSKEDRQAIDALIGEALLDEEISRQLVEERSVHLMSSFGLSSEAQAYLLTVEATTLEEFTQAVLDNLSPPEDD